MSYRRQGISFGTDIRKLEMIPNSNQTWQQVFSFFFLGKWKFFFFCLDTEEVWGNKMVFFALYWLLVVKSLEVGLKFICSIAGSSCTKEDDNSSADTDPAWRHRKWRVQASVIWPSNLCGADLRCRFQERNIYKFRFLLMNDPHGGHCTIGNFHFIIKTVFESTVCFLCTVKNIKLNSQSS